MSAITPGSVQPRIIAGSACGESCARTVRSVGTDIRSAVDCTGSVGSSCRSPAGPSCKMSIDSTAESTRNMIRARLARSFAPVSISFAGRVTRAREMNDHDNASTTRQAVRHEQRDLCASLSWTMANRDARTTVYSATCTKKDRDSTAMCADDCSTVELSYLNGYRKTESPPTLCETELVSSTG